MAYTKNPTWVDGEGGGTRIDAADLNAIEDGIFNAAAVADAAMPKSLADAKGDLFVASADNTIVRKAVGTNGQILMADSNTADGLGWQAPIPVLKNLLANSDFSNGTSSWNGINATIANESGRVAITATAQYGGGRQTVSLTAGRVYFLAGTVEHPSAALYLVALGIAGSTAVTTSTAQTRLSSRFTAPTTGSVDVGINDSTASSWVKGWADNAILIDLTAAFGAGLEPTKAEMDAYMARYTNSWFADTTPQLWSGSDWIKRTQNACKNEVVNGDFSNGTSGWGASRSALSSSGIVGIITADGTGVNPALYRQLGAGTPAIGSKIYFAGMMRTTNDTLAECTSLSLTAFGVTVPSQSAPVNNTWYTFTYVGTTTNLDPPSYVYYWPAGVSSGKTAEVKYPLLINLTQTFGAGNEPTKSEMDYLLSLYPNNWFNGTVNDLVPRRNIRDRIGSGSPEGVITAPVGTNWTDIADTVGATKWIKKSGTTSAGWEPSVLNTGWRTVTSAGWLVNGWTASAMYVQRVGQDVVLQIEGLNASAMTATTFLALPTGFVIQNSLDTRGILHAATVPATVYRTSRMDVVGATTGTPLLYGSLRWRTLAGTVPTALPGTAF